MSPPPRPDGQPTSAAAPGVTVRPLRETDVAEADRVFRLAFGTFLGLANPLEFGGDRAYARHRLWVDPEAAFAAEVDGRFAGSNFASHWGSVGFFGPLTIDPAHWDKGIGSRLMEPVMARFAAWGTEHAGLYTFANSAKHLGLYQKFGFWPRFLTAVQRKPVGEVPPEPGWRRYTTLSEDERAAARAACREVAGAVYPGLDLSREIRAVAELGLGEVVLLDGSARLEGFAICHCGPGTEAGSGSCYVKFGAVRPGAGAARAIHRLLAACEALAAERGLGQLMAGVNLAREGACRVMAERGFRTLIQGVAMHRPNEPGYNRPDAFVVDDWR